MTLNSKPSPFLRRLAEILSLSILLEVSAYPKPGNVHRLRDRPGLRYEAFMATGILSTRYFERGLRRGFRGVKSIVVGDLVYGIVRDVIRYTRSSNTCLGSSLILSILSVTLGEMYRENRLNVDTIGMTSREILKKTTTKDSIYYYKAIRVARPSYLRPDDQTGDYVNVWDPAYRRRLLERGDKLIDILEYASRVDVVSDEVLKGFPRGYQAEKYLRERISTHGDLNRGIVETYLYLLSTNKDTIVFLKHGESTAQEISEKASIVLDRLLHIDNSDWHMLVLEFDHELYQRNINPGSIADLIAETIAIYLLRNLLDSKLLLDLSK